MLSTHCQCCKILEEKNTQWDTSSLGFPRARTLTLLKQWDHHDNDWNKMEPTSKEELWMCLKILLLKEAVRPLFLPYFMYFYVFPSKIERNVARDEA